MSCSNFIAMVSTCRTNCGTGVMRLLRITPCFTPATLGRWGDTRESEMNVLTNRRAFVVVVAVLIAWAGVGIAKAEDKPICETNCQAQTVKPAKPKSSECRNWCLSW